MKKRTHWKRWKIRRQPWHGKNFMNRVSLIEMKAPKCAVLEQRFSLADAGHEERLHVFCCVTDEKGRIFSCKSIRRVPLSA